MVVSSTVQCKICGYGNQCQAGDANGTYYAQSRIGIHICCHSTDSILTIKQSRFPDEVTISTIISLSSCLSERLVHITTVILDSISQFL